MGDQGSDTSKEKPKERDPDWSVGWSDVEWIFAILGGLTDICFAAIRAFFSDDDVSNQEDDSG
jgi:hypothetical protein